MNATREYIISQLKKEILLLEGFKEPLLAEEASIGRINESFPNGVFPFSSLHEFFCYSHEEMTASSAFIAAMLSSRRGKKGAAIWISPKLKIFPPALKWFGIQPHQVLFLHVKKEKEVSWAINEALKCSSLSAVIGEMPEMSLTASRRFQLAIEDAGVGCFILRNNPKNLLTTAVSRWHVQPIHSKVEDDFPGVGHPRWRIKLLKVRNGRTGSWDIEWVNRGFRYSPKLVVIHNVLQKQAS